MKAAKRDFHIKNYTAGNIEESLDVVIPNAKSQLLRSQQASAT